MVIAVNGGGGGGGSITGWLSEMAMCVCGDDVTVYDDCVGSDN